MSLPEQNLEQALEAEWDRMEDMEERPAKRLRGRGLFLGVTNTSIECCFKTAFCTEFDNNIADG